MKVEKIDIFINELTSTLRDIKLSSIDDSNTFKLAPPKRRFPFLYRGYKKLNELIDIGGIITGSRALKFYHINGIPLITRKCNDWDIMLDNDSFYKFCALHNLKKLYYEEKSIISVNLATGIYTGKRTYSDEDTYLFRNDFDIISKKDLPNFNQCGKYRIASLESIIDYKLRLIKDDFRRYSLSSNYESKHLDDCLEIMVKLKAYYNIHDAITTTLDMSDEIQTKVLLDLIKINELK